MLPERYLKWREWLSELLSNMISLMTIQYSKTELNKTHAILAISISIKKKRVLSCALMQSDITQCLFPATRAAGRETEGVGVSKGLSERAPFPPGHILHYPPG